MQEMETTKTNEHETCHMERNSFVQRTHFAKNTESMRTESSPNFHNVFEQIPTRISFRIFLLPSKRKQWVAVVVEWCMSAEWFLWQHQLLASDV